MNLHEVVTEAALQLEDAAATVVPGGVEWTRGGRPFAYVAANGDRIGLAWSDDSSGNYEVFFQPFDMEGGPLEPPRQLSDTPTSSMIPAIVPWGDGFALAWDEVERVAASENTLAEVVFTTVP